MSGNDATTALAATFARNLKSARKAAGLTQRDLAVRLGRREMTVSEWERGGYRPNDSNLVGLADLLERDVAWFFTDHEPEGLAA